MHESSIAAQTPSQPPHSSAHTARKGGIAELHAALEHSRQDTLALFAVYEAALPGLQVPFSPAVNPPLWELGHIGWFQEYWLARNPQWALGVRADPQAARRRGVRDRADALYNSSEVPHASRWSLTLPDAAATRADLSAQLQSSLVLLEDISKRPGVGADRAQDTALDDTLYFFRLALHHEDMHHEAALYMAQALGIAVPDVRWQAPVLPEPCDAIILPAETQRLGQPAGIGDGFAFDNEYGHLDVQVPAFHVDAQVVRWSEYLPFVESGGAATVPRYLRPTSGGWQQWRHGQWRDLN